jgi:hypothetical protein
VVFLEHHEYVPCTSHWSPSFEADVMNVDSLKSIKRNVANTPFLNIFYVSYQLESICEGKKSRRRIRLKEESCSQSYR